MAKDKVKALKDILFPVTLEELERCISGVTWLRRSLPWFQQKMELQEGKQRLLEEVYRKSLLKSGITNSNVGAFLGAYLHGV